MALLSDIDKSFVETVALLVKEGWNADHEYRRGWLEGYSRAYTQLTGKTVWQLAEAVNVMLAGSGKSLNI